MQARTFVAVNLCKSRVMFAVLNWTPNEYTNAQMIVGDIIL